MRPIGGGLPGGGPRNDFGAEGANARIERHRDLPLQAQRIEAKIHDLKKRPTARIGPDENRAMPARPWQMKFQERLFDIAGARARVALALSMLLSRINPCRGTIATYQGVGAELAPTSVVMSKLQDGI
ncbi:hypothetical protein ACE10Z_33755 [Bradyrhizobium sp. Pha-3]|uniref:hypothetical protein n=1 Tax=Bradyrhizobium sp. Pha-3 TaxID=208375 RepID=UPI0035D5178A